MPQIFYDKVEYLCSNISAVEWSGILLYSFEGTIEQPENLVITLQDIILMDKGSGSYTEYQYNQEGRDPYIDYREKYPERKSWRIGHIHSHNSMGVFFSGTDMDELKENGPSHVFYLSLIVNNRMETCAKIAYHAHVPEESIERNILAKNEKNEVFTLKKVIFKLKKNLLCVHECEIEKPKKEVEMDDFFLKNVEEVLNTSKNFSTYLGNYGRTYIDPNEDLCVSPYARNTIKYINDEQVSTNVSNLFNNKSNRTTEKFLIDFFSDFMQMKLSENISLAKTIEILDDSNLSLSILEDCIEHNFIESLCKYFNYNIIDEKKAIPLRLKDCVNKLKVFRSKYPFLKTVIETINYSLKNPGYEKYK